MIYEKVFPSGQFGACLAVVVMSCVLMGISFPGSTLNDGQWHSVELSSRRGRLSVTVDNEESARASPSFPVTIESHLFFGGKSGRGQL